MFGFFANKLTRSDAVAICDELARFLVRKNIPASEFAMSHEGLLLGVVKHLGYQDYVMTKEQAQALLEQTIHWAYQHSENIQEKTTYWAERKQAKAELTIEDNNFYSPNTEHKEFLDSLNAYLRDQVYLDRQKWKK